MTDHKPNRIKSLDTSVVERVIKSEERKWLSSWLVPYSARTCSQKAACPRGRFPGLRSNGFAGRHDVLVLHSRNSRCQSQENADASGPPIMETEITKRVPPIKRFVTACNCLPRPWRALLALAFTRHKHDRRTIESCTNTETRKLFLTCTSKVIVIWYREWNEIGS